MNLSIKIQSSAVGGFYPVGNGLIEGIEYRVIDVDQMELLQNVKFVANGVTHHIKKGFKWGASIPKLFWRFIGKPTEPKFALASLIHDFLYQRRFDRTFADNAFRELLVRAGVMTWKVAMMFLSVRAGGHMFYAARSHNNKLSTRVWRWVVLKLYGDKIR